MTREEAIHLIENHKYPQANETWAKLSNEAIDMAIESLQTELVRCKDCKWKKMYYNDDESFYCDKTGIINMHIEDGDDEFWCKYGERGEL